MKRNKVKPITIWAKKPITNRILHGTIVYDSKSTAQSIYKDNIVEIKTDSSHLKEVGYIVAGYEVVKIIELSR